MEYHKFLKPREVKAMNAILAGLGGVIWANIAIVLMILSFLGGEYLAMLVFLGLVFATPFVLNKMADLI